VNESRMWLAQAQAAGISSFTFLAMLGSLIERSENHQLIWAELGLPPQKFQTQIVASDLYPDALPCLRSIQKLGLSIGIAGNQPIGAVEQLKAAGITADFIASSAHWGVSKPSKDFFARIVAESGVSAQSILYVGDR